MSYDSYDSFIPHPSTFLASRDPASESSASRWSWVLPVVGVALATAAAAFLVWLFFFRAKAPAIAAPSAAKVFAEIANPFNWK